MADLRATFVVGQAITCALVLCWIYFLHFKNQHSISIHNTKYATFVLSYPSIQQLESGKVKQIPLSSLVEDVLDSDILVRWNPRSHLLDLCPHSPILPIMVLLHEQPVVAISPSKQRLIAIQSLAVTENVSGRLLTTLWRLLDTPAVRESITESTDAPPITLSSHVNRFPSGHKIMVRLCVRQLDAILFKDAFWSQVDMIKVDDDTTKDKYSEIAFESRQRTYFDVKKVLTALGFQPFHRSSINQILDVNSTDALWPPNIFWLRK